MKYLKNYSTYKATLHPILSYLPIALLLSIKLLHFLMGFCFVVVVVITIKQGVFAKVF